MGFAIAFFVSFVALFTFGAMKDPATHSIWQAPPVQDVAVWKRESDGFRPERRSVMSDADGNARRTADGTQLTRRDRGREFWAWEKRRSSLKVEPVPAELTQSPQDMTVVPAMPMAGPEAMSVGRTVKNAIFSNQDLSEGDKAAVRVSQVGNKIVLSGVVASPKKKELIRAVASEVAGSGYVIEDHIVALTQRASDETH